MLADMIVKYKRFDFNQCFLFKKEVNGGKCSQFFKKIVLHCLYLRCV